VSAVVALLLIVAMALIAAWLLAWPLLGAWLAATRRIERGGRSWARFTPAVVVLPVLGGGFVAVSAFVPGDPHLGHVLACHCDLSHPGWLHLCPVHPMSATPLLLLLAMPALLLVFRPVLVALRLHAGLAGPARRVPGAPADGGIQLLDLGVPLACTSGLLRPFAVVDSGYWSSLDGDSRRVIAAHEDAHVRRRDPLTQAWLLAWTAFVPGVLARALVHHWQDHAELRADGHAAAAVGDPVLVAEVLVRQRRAQAAIAEPAMAWNGNALQRRVTALLGEGATDASARSDLDPGLLIVALAASATVMVFSPWLHHNLEHLINNLF
jgi:hypothetical protein